MLLATCSDGCEDLFALVKPGAFRLNDEDGEGTEGCKHSERRCSESGR